VKPGRLAGERGVPDRSARPCISTAKAVSTGTFGSCALLAGGTVKCWGDNRYGELGTGKAGSTYLYPYSFTPVVVKGL
jgi:tartrate dehydratase beta subunit/fumarate hydratase class I family protein